MNKDVRKAVKDFYGSKIQTGLLHKKMHVAPGDTIPAKKENKELSTLKKKATKTKAEVKKERELVFAKNAKKWHHK